jgi:hypothetical protein
VVETRGGAPGRYFTDIDLDISDCSKMISLGFDGYTLRDLKHSLDKAKLIQKEINQFVDAIERHYEFRKEHEVAGKLTKKNGVRIFDSDLLDL